MNTVQYEVMRVTDNETGEAYWVDGTSVADAKSTIGEDITVEHMVAVSQDAAAKLDDLV